MLSHADIALLGMVAIIVLVSILASHLKLRRAAAEIQKYPLFKVRDELIYLVGSGTLKEDNYVFQVDVCARDETRCPECGAEW